jgi:hypothetical protein
VNGDGYADIVIASGNTNERVYVSLGGPEGPSAPTIFSPGFPYQAVAGVDDVNGDGFADVVIAPFTYPSNAGTADLYLGSAGGLSKTPIVLIGPGPLCQRSCPVRSPRDEVGGDTDAGGV